MIRNRIACVAALLLAGAFYIFYVDYFSYYLLLYVLIILGLSALVFVPGVFSLRHALNPAGAGVRAGSPFQLHWTFYNRLRLPLVYVGGEVRYTNLMTGETHREKVMSGIPPRGKRLQLTYTPAHCGLIHCEVLRIKAYDFFGVFSFRLRAKETAGILSLPQEVMLKADVDLSVPANSAVRKKSGAINPYGNYDIREYRPGDSMRDVHWKLSAKLDELYVKEVNENAPAGVMLLMDLNITPEEADRAFSYAMAFAKQLIDRRLPFHILRADMEKGMAVQHFVETEDDLFRALRAIFSTRLKPGGKPIEELAGDISSQRLFYAKPDGILDVNRGVLLEGRAHE